MRILFISGYNHPSHHRKVELLADSVDVDILHILGPDSGRTGGTYLSANAQREYKIHILPVRQLGHAGDPHRSIHWPPSFGLRDFRPDIIHCEHEQESLMAAEVALARDTMARNIPLVLHSWQNILRQRSLPVRVICAYTLRAAQFVLCGNQGAADILRQQGYRGGIALTNIIGLDKRFFYPKPVSELRARLGLKGVIIGYFGRRVREKGIDTLLKAIAQLSARPQVVIGGSGPETDNLIALAENLGIASQCHFLDGSAIPYDSLVDYINLLDVLVVPSRTTPHWKEQLGRVVLEGMGCRVTVVGSDSGAMPAVIGPGGCIFPEDDSSALAHILDELIAKPQLRLELAEIGYRRVLALFSVERLAEDVMEVWKSLANHGIETTSHANRH
jgi:glycosyltransferase involved in cell wall biosynthesis